jgi:phospholipid/cholesterol/gamma-HCH transport system substrate-binding protein
MLTRFVRTQLVIFTIASVIGLATMIFGYLQLPTWLGLGHITVTLELKGTGGLYRFGNVTYRGVQIGKVSSVEPTPAGATAVLSLNDAPKIPADVRADIRSVSAVGEQYVDLIPRGDGPPFLEDGSVIRRDDTTTPQKVGPVLDQLESLVASVPKEKLTNLLDESFRAFNGAGYDVGSLLDSGSRLAADAHATAERTRALIEDTSPLLDSQLQSAQSLGTWARSLHGVTDQLVQNDPDLRTVLNAGPAAAQEVSRLLSQLKPTLPVLLANLTSVAQVGVTYNPSLRQLLVLFPPYVAGLSSLSGMNNPTGMSLGAFSLMNGDPAACTVGFLPPSQWRSPADESVVDTPDDLYCKLPQDAPIGVRGVRNDPCMGHPGKRAPTVQICNSDQPYEPLAMRQHILGPYPLDPNLISQGVPPDSRVDPSQNLYGPLAGTPPPPLGPGAASAPQPDAPIAPPTDAPPAPQPAGNPDQAPVAPHDSSGRAPGDAPVVAPNAFSGNVDSGATAAVANYDPRTGRYVGADGLVYRQTDLTRQGATTGWQDMLPH